MKERKFIKEYDWQGDNFKGILICSFFSVVFLIWFIPITILVLTENITASLIPLFVGIISILFLLFFSRTTTYKEIK